jgi:hypothetical protein
MTEPREGHLPPHFPLPRLKCETQSHHHTFPVRCCHHTLVFPSPPLLETQDRHPPQAECPSLPSLETRHGHLPSHPSYKILFHHHHAIVCPLPPSKCRLSLQHPHHHPSLFPTEGVLFLLLNHASHNDTSLLHIHIMYHNIILSHHLRFFFSHTTHILTLS